MFVIFRNNLNGYWDFYHGTNVGAGFTLCPICSSHWTRSAITRDRHSQFPWLQKLIDPLAETWHLAHLHACPSYTRCLHQICSSKYLDWKQWCRIIETPFRISGSIPAARAARRRPYFCCRLLKLPSLVLGLHNSAGRSTSAFSVLREIKSERNLLLIITDAIINNWGYNNICWKF
jgi:hypothetical protein